MSETIPTQAVRELVEQWESWDRCYPGNINIEFAAEETIAALRALVEERDRLAEANAKKADDIVTLGQLVGKAEARAEAAEAALLDAQKRLRGAGMLGGDNDPVNVARRALEGGESDE